MTDDRLAALRSRYGHHTTGPNWQAEDYADGPAKDSLLNQAKHDIRDLLDEIEALQAALARVEALVVNAPSRIRGALQTED